MVKEFINEYGMTIVYAILTAIAGFLGTQIKKIYEDKVNNETKKNFAETCVKAVEQLYKNLDGAEKFQKASDNLVEMLSVKGIVISDLEIEMLIEATVSEFSVHWKAGENNDANAVV